MAETVANTIIKLQRYFPDVTAAIGLDLLNDIHAELNEDFALRVTTESFILIVDGTREYALSEDTLAVWSVIWHTSATASHKLEEISIDELDEQHGNWRARADGTPRFFYISTNTSGPVIGFYPTPDTTTSASYPQAVAHVSKKSALTDVGSLPTGLRSSRLYVVGAAWLYAEQMYPDRAPMFEAAYLREKGKLGAYMMRRQRRNPPTVLPRWIQGRGRRI